MDKPCEQRNLVILIEVVPNHIGKGVDIAFYLNAGRLTLVRRNRIAVTAIGMNEMPFACDRILVIVKETTGRMRIAVGTFENRQRIVIAIYNTEMRGV